MFTTKPTTMLSLFCLAVAFALVAPTPARSDDGFLQARAKIALGEMVTEVREAGTPDEKRSVMNGFLDRIEGRAHLLEKLPLDDAQRAALTSLQHKFAGYSEELRGEAGTGVADEDLDAFAGFMQQDLEQAASTWGSGGIYLSTGAVIIILLILLLIT